MLKGNFLVWSDKLYKTIFFGFFLVSFNASKFFLAWFINLPGEVRWVRDRGMSPQQANTVHCQPARAGVFRQIDQESHLFDVYISSFLIIIDSRGVHGRNGGGAYTFRPSSVTHGPHQTLRECASRRRDRSNG